MSKRKEPRMLICDRCKGDGVWHSTKTGYRANTAAEPLIDKKRKCPQCEGVGKMVILPIPNIAPITMSQYEQHGDEMIANAAEAKAEAEAKPKAKAEAKQGAGIKTK